MVADTLYDSRDRVAALPALALLAVLLTASVPHLVKRGEEVAPIVISLEREAPASPDPPTSAPRAEPPALRPHKSMPAPVARTPEQPYVPTPRVDEPGAEAPASPKPSRAEAREPTQFPVVPAPRAAPSESLEGGYVAKLRAYLNGVKRYPTSREARQQRPQGKVRVWLDVARDGQLLGAGLEESSGSMILDGAALSTVRQGHYPAIPAEAWAGRDFHRFTVTLEYALETG